MYLYKIKLKKKNAQSKASVQTAVKLINIYKRIQRILYVFPDLKIGGLLSSAPTSIISF